MARTGSPLWNLAFGLSLNVADSPSSASEKSSASSPYMEKGSSQLLSVSMSTVSVRTPTSLSPLRVNGLNVSKPPCIGRENTPPFGASGLTYS